MFEIPESKKSLDQNQFQFSYQGTDYSIPKIRYLSPVIVRSISSMTPTETVFYLLDQFGSGDLVNQLEDMEQVEALYRAWMTDSGIDVGESSASGNSSASTLTPSAATSSGPGYGSKTSAPI